MFEGLFQPMHLLLLIFVAAACLVPFIFYMLTLQKTLARCNEQSRTTSPESVWLMLIPIFNLIYNFILVNHIAKSLHNELVRREIVANPEPGKPIGTAMCVLNICSFIPVIGFLLTLAALVCWILYWVEIADYSGMIALPLLPAQQPQSLT